MSAELQTFSLRPLAIPVDCRVTFLSNKSLIKNMSWMTSISIVERIAGLLQTVLIARVLGITEYGIYGLIFGTIGLAASVAAIQMGFTATVFISRYRNTDKDKAAFVISFVNRFSLAVSFFFLMVALPFSAFLSQWLIGDSGSEWAIVAGCLLVALSIIGGVQDGIIQGFEDFRSIALVRLATTLVSLSCVYPVGRTYGLLGVMAVMLLGPVFKYFLLVRTVRLHVRRYQLPPTGGGLRGKDLLWDFSIPSMLASLLAGVTGWLGTLMLSRQANGFDALAIVNTGLQWRGPVFLLASAMSAVAIPAISRHFQSGNDAAIQRLHHQVLWFNGGVSLLAVLVLTGLAPMILKTYGAGFAGGDLVFSLVIASTLPQAMANVYLQELSAKGLMWRQNFLYLGLVVPMFAGFYLLIPSYQGIGYALANLASWVIFALALMINKRSSK